MKNVNKKEFCLRNSPPAAGRVSGIFFPAAVRSPGELFYSIGVFSYGIKKTALAAVVCAMVSFMTAGAAWGEEAYTVNEPMERAYEPLVNVYEKPDAMPEKYSSSDFQVQAGGLDIPVYVSGNNAWGNPVSYGTFESTGPVEIQISAQVPFTDYALLPESLGLSGQRAGNKVTFTAQPGTDITFLPDRNYNGRVLHLFVREPLTDIPDIQSDQVIHYGPGYYDLSGRPPLMLRTGQTLYLEGGAVLRGRVLVQDADHVTICGPGILLNDYVSQDSYDGVAVALKNANDVTVRDITVIRDMNSWISFMWKCSNVTVKNYKAINARYASSDGFNVANCQGVLFDGSFIHSCDDSVAIKGTGNNGYNPAEDPSQALPTSNITYQNSQLWSDANNAIGIGAETQAGYFDQIRFQNIDILRNYDDLNYPDQLTERSAINICALNATQIQNVTFEDIRVEKAKRLINITMEDSFWFGSLAGNWQWPGSIQNVTYRNITSKSDGSNQIRISGHDSNHLISDIHFENIKIQDTPLTDFDTDIFSVNSFGKNIRLVSDLHPEGVTADGPITAPSNRYQAAEQLSDTQGGNGWYYRTWQAGVGTLDMAWNPDGSNHWRGPKQWDAIWVEQGQLLFHPDETQILLDWKAPRSGVISISGTVRKYASEGGDGVNVSIWKNDRMIWPVNGAWRTIDFDDTAGVAAEVSTSVVPDDVISFRVDKRGNPAYDSTAWTPTIIYE